MSAPGPECIICGRIALDLSGWDGGFPSYREFRAVWDPPRVFQDMVHFACLREWKHRDELLAELVDLATDAVLEFDVEIGGTTHHLTRDGLGYSVRRFDTRDLLALQHGLSGDWLIIDFAGAWQFVGRSDLLRLVRGEPVRVQGGRGRYGITLSAAPSADAVASWALGDLLRHLGVDSRYPGLTATDASLHVSDYNAETGWLGYRIDHPLNVHPAVLEFFRGEYEHAGEAAFAAPHQVRWS